MCPNHLPRMFFLVVWPNRLFILPGTGMSAPKIIAWTVGRKSVSDIQVDRKFDGDVEKKVGEDERGERMADREYSIYIYP
jgi:hypothetical protein